MAWNMLRLSMFKELRQTGGIGARIVSNIPVTSMKDALEDPIKTSVTSVEH